MNNQLAGVLSFLAVCLLYVSSSASAASAPASSDSHASKPKPEVMFLLKLLPNLKELAKDADDIESLVEKVIAQGSYPDMSKRQWDQDYGWGGGRFGKRDYGFGGGRFGKRYDIYGMSGRFGRDVDHVDLINHDRQ